MFPTPPAMQTGKYHNEEDLQAKLLGLFERIDDGKRRQSMEDAIKILQAALQSMSLAPSISVDDPANEAPPIYESITPYLVPSASDGGNRFTLPSSDPLALKRRYDRRWAVLPGRMANMSCGGVKPETLLTWLNSIFGTHLMPSDGVNACLLQFIDDGCDLGQVYGYTRPWIYTTSTSEEAFSKITDNIRRRREEDFNLRSAAINSNRIVNPKIPPRRVWDLYAHRVLPYYATLLHSNDGYGLRRKLWAVSHSWVPPSDRQTVLTTVNGKAWRVPIPRGTTIEEIRDELLILGAEYVFLDVLCLRQKDELLPEFESIRKREWRLDVPTIGHVYSDWRPTIVYFNGLGLPFRDGGMNSGDRFHWFNRAWTLQEWPALIIPGGLKRKLEVMAVTLVGASSSEAWASRDFFDHFASITRTRWKNEGMEGYMKEIQSRFCSNPVDQVTCLGYLLGCPTLPIYDADMDVEVAWSLLVECLPDEKRTQLLFSDFGPGGPSGSWRPTWKQMNACSTIRIPFMSRGWHMNTNKYDEQQLKHLDGSSPRAGFKYGFDAYYHSAFVIEECSVSIQDSNGYLSVPCTCDAGARCSHHGRLSISEWDGPIAPHTTYLLIGVRVRLRARFGKVNSRSRSPGYWLLARRGGIRRINNERAIEVSKVSILTISATHDDGTLGEGVKGVEMLVVYR